MKISSLITVPALAAALCAGSAFAQGAATPGTGSSVTGGQAAPAAQAGAGTRNKESRKDDRLARGDRKFMQKAAEGGMFEVQVAQLAASKATDPQVKSFASMLVDEHTAANNELVQLANMKGVELPAGPPRGKRKDIEKLGKKSGADFDKEFVKHVGLKDHEKDIKMFEHASKDVKDPQLKAWVDKTLPNLRKHLQMAQQLPEAGNKHAGLTMQHAPTPPNTAAAGGAPAPAMAGATGGPGGAGPGGVGGGSLNPRGKGS